MTNCNNDNFYMNLSDKIKRFKNSSQVFTAHQIKARDISINESPSVFYKFGDFNPYFNPIASHVIDLYRSYPFTYCIKYICENPNFINKMEQPEEEFQIAAIVLGAEISEETYQKLTLFAKTMLDNRM